MAETVAAEKPRPSWAAGVVSSRDLPRDRVRVMLCGESGSGKTYQILTAAEAGERVVCVDTEEGSETLRRAGVDIWRPTATDPAKVWEQTLQVVQAVSRDPGDHTLLALDTITSLVDPCMAYVCHTQNIPSPLDLGRTGWGAFLREMKQMAWALRKAPLHIIVNAHLKGMEVEEGPAGEAKLRIFRLGIPGQGSDQLYRIFDEVYVLLTSDIAKGNIAKFRLSGHVKYFAVTNAGGTYLAKSRMAALRPETIPPVIENPSWTFLKKALEQS